MTDTASTRLAAWEPGYRRLEEGEIILATDEVQNDDGSWKATICAGQRAPDPAYTAHRVYRRALSTAQASERKQIAAWLRTSGHSDPGAFAQRAYATAFADAIERGDYLATPVEQPAPAEAQQPNDELVEEIENLTRVDPGFYVLGSDLRNRILSALKARTSPETVENFIKLHEEWQQAMELLRETRGTMAEQVRRCERWGKSHHEMDAAISAIDAHLSNTPDQGSDQHERS